MKYLLLFENFDKIHESNAYSLEEYNSYISNALGKFDLRPAQVNHLIDFYSNDIETAFDEGQVPNNVVDKIVKELELDKGTGFPTVKIPNMSIRQLKYL